MTKLTHTALALVSSIILFVPLAAAQIKPAAFDFAQILDENTLETTVLQDWHPAPKLPDVKLKLIEITVCEWWPGQKVRLPVTLCAPASGAPCTHVIVANMGLSPKASAPTGAMLTLLRDHRVGVVLAGMGTIDMMQPVGQLHLGMKEQLLKTKDARYTAAWIWGLSDMRALTAAVAEKSAFQPTKVLATGGSKRGVGAALCGIHDPRFTAILPVVAPILGNPGGDFVQGTVHAEELRLNAQFLDRLLPGPNPLGLPATARQALMEAEGRRATQSITLGEALAAGWSQAEILQMNDAAWNGSRITAHLDQVRARSLEYFYHVGTNDNVCPSLLELGQAYPDFPIYILPGGQHGGPQTSGFTLQTPTQKEVSENLLYFARHHFLGEGQLPKSPHIDSSFDDQRATLTVSVRLSEPIETQHNQLSWCENRSRPYTYAATYDQWRTLPLTSEADGHFTAEITVPNSATTIDFVTTHNLQQATGSFHFSSPYQRWSRSKTTSSN